MVVKEQQLTRVIKVCIFYPTSTTVQLVYEPNYNFLFTSVQTVGFSLNLQFDIIRYLAIIIRYLFQLNLIKRADNFSFTFKTLVEWLITKFSAVSNRSYFARLISNPVVFCLSEGRGHFMNLMKVNNPQKMHVSIKFYNHFRELMVSSEANRWNLPWIFQCALLSPLL